jgi:hypothetical protein
MKIPRYIMCHILAALFSISVIAAPILMLADRHPAITIHSVDIFPKEIYPGSEVTFKWLATEHRNCDGIVRRFLITNVNKPGMLPIVQQFEQAPTTYHYAMQHTPQSFQTKFSIPKDAEPGQAIYRSKVTRWCNVFQQYIWPIQEEDINVSITILGPEVNRVGVSSP